MKKLVVAKVLSETGQLLVSVLLQTLLIKPLTKLMPLASEENCERR